MESRERQNQQKRKPKRIKITEAGNIKSREIVDDNDDDEK